MRCKLVPGRCAGLVFSLVVGCSIAHPETLNYGVDAGLGETDNVRLAHADKVSQTIAVTDLNGDYQHKSQRLDVDARGNFSYLDYLQNAYGRQLLGRFDGVANVALVPQRLTWALQDSFGQAAVDPFTPTVPNNLENINTVSTGPDLYVRLGTAGFLNFSARVAHAQFATSPFTNSRGVGSAAWGLKLSPVSSISVNGDAQRVLFENTALNTDFSRSNAFVRYELQGARSDLSADLGATMVRESGASNTGGLAKFRLARSLSASARITMTLGHATTDGSTSFSGLQGGATGVVGTAPSNGTSQNYVSNYGLVGWDYQRYRTSLGFSGQWENDTYAGQRALDRTLTTGEMRFQRVLSKAFVFQVTERIYRSSYANANVTGVNASPRNTTNSITAALTWRHGRALEVKLAGEHTSYATAPNDTGYGENRVSLTVGYRPFQNASFSEDIPASMGEQVPRS